MRDPLITAVYRLSGICAIHGIDETRGDVFMNIMITCIGELQETAPVIQYNKGAISAQMTSEACCKYLLKKRGHAPDIVIVLCTPNACKESKDKKQRSSYSYFETTIQDFCRSEKLNTPVFEIVKISKSEESANYYGKSIYKVHQLIQENVLRYDTRIMIDTSLKSHPISIMLQMMTRLLKNDGYKMIEFYYAYPEKQRISEDNTNHQLDMVEAISEFSAHGTAEKMCACFSQNTRKKSDPIVVRLMEAMQRFSDSIQLCQTESLQDILNNEIFPTLEVVENMTGASSMREDVFTLKLMAEDIRKKFGYSKTGDTLVSSPMLLIEWCLKNRYIQQAVTLFVESIPKYLVSSGILQYSSPLVNRINSPEVNLLYSQILQACCTKGNNSASVSEANKANAKPDQIALMNKYLQSGSLSEQESRHIQFFISTIDYFKKMIGNKRPKTALHCYSAANYAEQLLLDCINSFDPSNYSKFINTLKTNPNTLAAFVVNTDSTDRPAEHQSPETHSENSTEINEMDKKLYGIKNFSMQAIRSSLRGIKLNIHRDKIWEFQRFLAYYVYIKKCIRNYLNHAREYNDMLTAEQISEFQKYSVHTGALTVKNITDNITEAMQCLNNCIIKDHKSIRPVKKYYLTLPKKPQYVPGPAAAGKPETQVDGISLKHYMNPMNSPYLNYTQTRFPIIPVIFNTVEPGEVIKIYGIKSNSASSSIWETELLTELDELLIKKDFDYEYEAIEMPDSSDISASLNLFRTFTETVQDDDKIYVDMTCIENQIPITLIMFMNYINKYHKSASVEAAVYGQYDSKLISYALYDVTKLICANNELGNLDETLAACDALSAIMSYGKQKPDKARNDKSEANDNEENLQQSDDSEPDSEPLVNDDNTEIENSDDASESAPAETEVNDTDADAEEPQTAASKKRHFSSPSKFRRSVGSFSLSEKKRFTGKPVTKLNKHLC